MAIQAIHNYFYPRSPCGERPGKVKVVEPGLAFLSTLSLRRATTHPVTVFICIIISIHALLAESDCFKCSFGNPYKISIHALLAESDRSGAGCLICLLYFYPRSPCGERLQKRLRALHKQNISIHALLAESDLDPKKYDRTNLDISIHALLAESDLKTPCVRLSIDVFLSTLSLRRATIEHLLII